MTRSFARTVSTFALSIALAGVAVTATSAAATDNPNFTAPGVQILDKLGIDIAGDQYVRNDTFLTIGDPANGGLAWNFIIHTVQPVLWSTYTGTVKVNTDVDTGAITSYTVTLGEGTIEFDPSFNNQSGDGSTLSSSGGNYTYTSRTGVVYVFTGTTLSTITYPNGTVYSIFSNGSGGGSVVSNRGYAFKIDATAKKIYAVNMAMHTCDAQAWNCDAYDNFITIGSVTDSAGLVWQTVTDSVGNVWQYNIKTMYFKAYVDGTKERRPPGIFGYKNPNGYFATIARNSTNGCITSFTDPRGTFTWARSVSGGVDTITVKDPSGVVLYTAQVTGDAICPTGSNILNYVQNAAGNRTTYNISQFGPNYDGLRINSVTNPEGNSVSYTYDARGNVTQITNTPKAGSGLGTTYIYANFDTVCGNLKTCNQPNWSQDARGNKTYYTYDPTHGGVTSVTSPADSNGLTPKKVTTYAQFTAQIRNSSGAMVNAGTIWLPQTVSTCATAVTCDGTANQLKSTMAYGTYNLMLSSVTTAAGDGSLTTTASSTYDAVGNVTSVDGPRTDVTDVSYTTYDALRRKVYEIGIDPDGSGSLQRAVIHHIYTGAQETQTEIGTGNAADGSDFARISYATATYNTMGKKTLAAVYIDGNGTPQTLSQFNYDNRGHIVCAAVRMNPSVYGTISGTDACSLGTTSSTYGPDRVTKNTYNNADQLTEVDQAYGVTGAQRAYARYTYTSNGQKQSETDANGNKTMYVYDGFDRLSQIQYPSTTIGTGGVNTADYEQYGYDANGNKTSWRRRDGQAINYSYDNLNRQTLKDLPGTTSGDVYSGYDLLSHVKYNRFGSTSGSGTTYYYDGLGRLSYVTDVNGRTVYYSYNQASARTQLTYPDMNNVGYGLDNANRMITLGWNSNSGYLAQNYDSLGRMISQGKWSGSTFWNYDPVGRLYSMTNDVSGTAYDIAWTFGYNPAGQVVSSAASSTVFDYKETASSTDSPGYDGLNRDTRLTGTTAACPSGGYDARQNLICDSFTNRAYTYDVENRLLTASGTGTTGGLTLTYDPEGRLSSYTAGGTTTTFLYDGVNLIAEYNGSAATPLRRYIHGTGTDNPLIWLEGAGAGDPRWLYTDYHGSVMGFTDAYGNLSQLYKYGPYGEPKDISNGDAWWTGASRFRYTGQIMLFEAKLYYYKARVYDPRWGRFLQTDPIGGADDLNLYAYVGNDPANRSDPTGLYYIGSQSTPVSQSGSDVPKPLPDCNDVPAGTACTVVVTTKRDRCDTFCQNEAMVLRMRVDDLQSSTRPALIEISSHSSQDPVLVCGVGHGKWGCFNITRDEACQDAKDREDLLKWVAFGVTAGGAGKNYFNISGGAVYTKVIGGIGLMAAGEYLADELDKSMYCK